MASPVCVAPLMVGPPAPAGAGVAGEEGLGALLLVLVLPPLFGIGVLPPLAVVVVSVCDIVEPVTGEKIFVFQMLRDGIRSVARQWRNPF